ncbi:Solute carrier family 22 member 20 [Papilio xuthus]|uniref:Solute carrier family 22 member 20 n=1 Tax=Papilio xuthus TaxID=66420 RepID=A0A194Q2M5_PAPXU|nr:Solute carrier family 22 member 20 [Papilio xuthus]
MAGGSKGEVEIDETMEKFGVYQTIQYFLICLPVMFVTMFNVNYVFVAGELNYRCRVPECDDQSTAYPAYKPSWWPDKDIDRCTRPMLKQLTGGACTKQSFSDRGEVCKEWVYETNDTVIAELDLACQPWKSNMIGAVHNVGLSIAWLASGYLAPALLVRVLRGRGARVAPMSSTMFGRKPTLILSGVLGGIGIFKAFTKSYFLYIVLEFLEGTIGGGCYTAAMVLNYKAIKVTLFLLGKLIVSVCFTGVITYTMELFPTSVRGTMLGVCSVCAGFGSILAPLTPILNQISIILPPLIFGATALLSGVLLTRTPETKGAPLMDTIEQLDRTYGQGSSGRS